MANRTAELEQQLAAARRAVAAGIEAGMAVLDELDGDPEAGEDDPAEDGGDREPSLGWTSNGRCCGTDDQEHEHDGAEPDASGIADDDGLREQLLGEPSLIATAALDQRIAWQGPDRSGRDRWAVEDGEAGDDNGVADTDGMLKQYAPHGVL